jgi:hypothetical protein
MSRIKSNRCEISRLAQIDGDDGAAQNDEEAKVREIGRCF